MSGAPRKPDSLDDVLGRLAVDHHRDGERLRLQKCRTAARWGATAIIVAVACVLLYVLSTSAIDWTWVVARLAVIGFFALVRWWFRD